MSVVSERNLKIVDEFRANEGRVGGWFEGKTLLLLHTKGAKSQQERINPVAYVKDGNRYVVIASKAEHRPIPIGITTSWPARW